MKITKIDLGDVYSGKAQMREALYIERVISDAQLGLLSLIQNYTYRGIVSATLERSLTFEEAFVGACYIVRASNSALEKRFFSGLETFGAAGNELAARELLSGFAMKEAHAALTPDEVAGLVAGANLDIVRLMDYGDRVIETCGMGGDRGILFEGEAVRRKTINTSTLSTLLLASIGHHAIKHGSYSNTSAVGSTNAVEQLGLMIDIPSVAAQKYLAQTQRFHYTDAHAWKTIHDLSHLPPMRETVNHILGPMTVPIASCTRLDKVLGVSDKIHPSVIARAYAKLHNAGIINVGNVAVVCGLSVRAHQIHKDVHMLQLEHNALRPLVVLDELSPWSSVVSLVHRGEYLGTDVVYPSDFMIEFENPHDVFIQNDAQAIYDANLIAASVQTTKQGHALNKLLAMNAALALYIHTRMDGDMTNIRRSRMMSRDALKECYATCFAAIEQNRVVDYLQQYRTEAVVEAQRRA